MGDEREPEVDVHERAEAPEEDQRAEEEYIVEHEVRRPHSWGDRRTWVILGILIVGAIVHSFFIRYLVSGEVMRPEDWNLGWPPTAPH